jgi:hypothetical protein
MIRSHCGKLAREGPPGSVQSSCAAGLGLRSLDTDVANENLTVIPNVSDRDRA